MPFTPKYSSTLCRSYISSGWIELGHHQSTLTAREVVGLGSPADIGCRSRRSRPRTACQMDQLLTHVAGNIHSSSNTVKCTEIVPFMLSRIKCATQVKNSSKQTILTFLLIFQSLPETFIRRRSCTSSSGSWHDENLNLTCQENGHMRDWVDSCLHRDSWTVHLPCGCIWPPLSTW